MRTASCATRAARAPASPTPSSSASKGCWRRWRATTARSPGPSRPSSPITWSPGWSRASSTPSSPRPTRCAIPSTRACATTSTRRTSPGRIDAHIAGSSAPFVRMSGMPRSMWSGAISFGLVNVPIKLYSAVSKKTVRFHQLNGETGNRIAQKRTDSVTGEEVAYENLVKGYELTRDQYVIIEPDELDALDPEKSRTIDIEDFVDLAEIDPIYYDHPYYLVPDKGATKAYGLLLNAMQESGRVAIARVVLRSKEQLVAIRPGQDGTVLMMETMIFADEVVPKADLDGLPEAEELKVSEREVQMAQQLIESLVTDFEPARYKDEYREKVLELIEAKAAGAEIVSQPEAPTPTAVPDLMAALEASLAAVPKKSSSAGKTPAKEKASA